MANEFLHNADGIDGVIENLKGVLETYSTNIGTLEELVNEISTSDDWLDKQVKTAYLEAAGSYLDAYKKYISGLEAYITALTTKSENISSFETTFSE